MKAFLVLARYQALIVFRHTGYWVTSLILAALAIAAFGSMFANPNGPRLGIVDEARSAESREFVQRAEDVDAFRVSIGTRDEQVNRLRHGERWAVVVLPPGFSGDGHVAAELYTAARADFSATAGAGIVRQLLTEVSGAPQDGVLSIEEQPVAGERPVRYVDFIVAGQVGLALMFGNLTAASLIAWWREEGVLKRFSAAPIRPAQLLAAQITVFGSFSLLQAALLLGIGWLLFGVSVRGSPIALILLIAAGIVAFLTLWYGIVSFVRSPVAAGGLCTLIAVIFVFASGTYLPLVDVPSELDPVLAAIPLKSLNDGLREIINHGRGIEDIATELGILTSWAAGFFYVSSRLFRWTTE